MNYSINFTEQELNLVINALAELPAKTSMNLINRIGGDIANINKKEELPVKTEKPVDLEEKSPDVLPDDLPTKP